MEHSYLCVCAACNYERVMGRIQEKYSTYEDPFPPTYTKIRTGRFKVYNPNTEQRIRYSGHWRRIKDDTLDVINWQFKPWSNAEWRTYYTMTFEELHRFTKKYGKSVAVTNFNVEANKALAQERFYKIERIDAPAQT